MCTPASIVSYQSEEGKQRWLYVCVSSHLKKTVNIYLHIPESHISGSTSCRVSVWTGKTPEDTRITGSTDTLDELKTKSPNMTLRAFVSVAQVALKLIQLLYNRCRQILHHHQMILLLFCWMKKNLVFCHLGLLSLLNLWNMTFTETKTLPHPPMSGGKKRHCRPLEVKH